MKQFLLSALFLITFSNFNTVLAQSTGYMKIPDPSNSSYFVRMIRTSDNGFLSCGVSGSAGINHEIIKWNSNFQVEWTKNFPSAAVTYWNDIIETNDGKFIAMAENQNHSGCNIIFKFDVNGSVIWQKEYYLNATFLTSFAISKAAGNDPGFIFGGGACGASNYLVRCDANGNIVWQNEYFVTGMSGVESIQTIIAENNAYIVTGNVLNGSTNDAYIMKVDSANALLWCKVIQEPTLNQIPAKCLKMASGNYVVLCGYNGNPNYAQLLYYFTSAGTVTNGAKLISPTQEQIYFTGLAEISSDKIILNGSVDANPMSYLYMGLAANGSIVWQKKSVGVTAGFLNGTGVTVAKTASNLFALGGESYTDGRTIAVIDSLGSGFCNSSTAFVQSVTPEAYTVVNNVPAVFAVTVLVTTVTNASLALTITPSTLCGTLGVSESTQYSSLLNVFPTPATNEITLDFGELSFGKAVVSLYNLFGEQVYSTSIANMNVATIDISQLASGIYMMEVLIDGEKTVRKVIKD